MSRFFYLVEARGIEPRRPAFLSGGTPLVPTNSIQNQLINYEITTIIT